MENNFSNLLLDIFDINNSNNNKIDLYIINKIKTFGYVSLIKAYTNIVKLSEISVNVKSKLFKYFYTLLNLYIVDNDFINGSFEFLKGFCNTNNKEYLIENDLAFATFDSYPVSKYHLLVIPKRHVENYFDLSNDEILACNEIIKLIKKKLEQDDQTIKGFNLGSNNGKAAGQSINHCHIHLIPRRLGDVDNPQGGVRAVISSKQHYVRKTK